VLHAGPDQHVDWHADRTRPFGEAQCVVEQDLPIAGQQQHRWQAAQVGVEGREERLMPRMAGGIHCGPGSDLRAAQPAVASRIGVDRVAGEREVRPGGQ